MNNRIIKPNADVMDGMMDSVESFINEEEFRSSKDLFPWTTEKRIEFGDMLKTEKGIISLLEDDYFLGLKGTIFDSVKEDIIDLWAERRQRVINLAIFIEAIGSGKSLKSSVILWLMWFELLCKADSPQEYYHLTPGSVIAFIVLSRTETQAKKVAFNKVMARFQSGFNKDYFPLNGRYTQEIRIDRNNTTMFPGTSSALSALGYDLFGGIIDEANFLEVVEDSRKAAMEDKYDAAEDMHNAIINRMTSRFMKNGIIPGLLMMISSPRFPEDYLERKIKESEDLGIASGIFWRKRDLWTAKGKKFFPANKFFYIDTDTLDEINPEKGAKIVKFRRFLTDMKETYSKNVLGKKDDWSTTREVG